MNKKKEKSEEKNTINESEFLFNTIESIEIGANKSINWSLSIIGGSLLVILNKDYIQPLHQELKFVYFLFGIGWALLGISMYYGRKISNSKMAALLNKQSKNDLRGILKNVNQFYNKQLNLFNWSLVIFGVWLMLYLIWWVFNYKS